jgi:hypothetical protein
MAILKQPTTSGSLFELPDELPPRGTFVATCIDVKDVFGVERKKFQSEETERVDVTGFLFGYRTRDGKPCRVASRSMKISGSEKSSLFGFLKAWLGRAPQFGWDYCTLKGQKALITVDHQPSRTRPGAVYAVIASVSPVPEGFGEAPPPASALVPPPAPPPSPRPWEQPAPAASAPPPQAAPVEDAGDELPF